MVKLVQMLCPQRHCLLLFGYEEGNGSFQESCDKLKSLIAPVGSFNDYCGICGSRELHFEEGTTHFQTLKEAMPSLTREMLANIRTRQVMDQLGLTYDKQRTN